jgi:hypothetical protein
VETCWLARGGSKGARRSDIGFCEDTDTCVGVGVPHYLATQYLRPKTIKPQLPNGIARSVSFVSATNTARCLARFVLLALALAPWRTLRVPAPGQAKKVAMLGSFDHVTRQLIVHTSPTKRSSDFIAHLDQLDRLYGP